MTQNGHFLFNMDNARDMVDVREMVFLQHLRLTGPTSAIEGVFNGPLWYYLLAIPFIVSGGDPYAGILMEIILWAVGGYFLFKLTDRYGLMSTISSGLLWVTSNYIVLLTIYTFNPNPVALLTPLFLFILLKFIETSKLKYSFALWIMAGAFFNFEMNAGIVLPLIIFLSVYILKRSYLKKRELWLGILGYLLCLLPQGLFDLKHGFIMTNSLMRFLLSNQGGNFSPWERLPIITDKFHEIVDATFLNHKSLTFISILVLIFVLLKLGNKKKIRKDPLLVILLLSIFVPFLIYIFLPVTVNSWHLGMVVTSIIILLGVVLGKLKEFGFVSRVGALLLFSLVVVFTLSGAKKLLNELNTRSEDPSLYANEIRVIDYVYQKAMGRDFKVYVYLPSVIDYPYQYLIYWHGLKTYGYLPSDYAYLPGKPPYINNKDRLYNKTSSQSSNSVFLIKQPDTSGIRHLWENNFQSLPLLSSESVGSYIVETRQKK
jgi:hypothetical protein